MAGDETPKNQNLMFDRSNSINHLTGNEFYFYSNDDAEVYKKKTLSEFQMGEGNINERRELPPVTTNDRKIIGDEVKNLKKNEKEAEKNKAHREIRRKQGDKKDYFYTDKIDMQHTYEEREKFVFEQEIDKVHDVYNGEEIMKIINKLNSIRKEIETVIYKKLETKYIEFLTMSNKIKDIEVFISNIKNLVAENTSELKFLQDKKYKESLNIVNLVTRREKFQKINLTILTIYIIHIYDKLIFKNILRKDYEYASLIYFELAKFLNKHGKLLHHLNCIHHLKGKNLIDYFNRLKQKNQINFVEFLFSNNGNKNLQTQLEKAFKIYFFLFKKKTSNFIENLLAYVYQCFRKISKQVIFSLVIVRKKGGGSRPNQSEGKQKGSHRDAPEKEAQNSKHFKREEMYNSTAQYLEKEKKLFCSEDKQKKAQHCELKTSDSHEQGINNTPPFYNTSVHQILNERIPNHGKNFAQSGHSNQKEGTSQGIPHNAYNINDVISVTYENAEELKTRSNKNTHNNSPPNENNPKDKLPSDINQLQEEDNFLFIPLNELVQKLNEKGCFLSLVKIYQIVFDVLNKYDSIISYLVNYAKNEASSGGGKGIKMDTISLNGNNKNDTVSAASDFPKHHTNRGSATSARDSPDRNGKPRSQHSEDNELEKNDSAIEKDDSAIEKDDSAIEKDDAALERGHSLDDATLEGNSLQGGDHPDNFSFYDLFNEYRNEKRFSTFSKFYQMSDGNSCSPQITDTVKNVDIENCTFAEYSQKIKEKFESYLKARSIHYDHSEAFLYFALDNANKLISAKNKFLRNIEKVLKTIIEHMKFENFGFHYIFRFAVVTIMFCLNSFLFQRNSSNSCIYHLGVDNPRGILPKEGHHKGEDQNGDVTESQREGQQNDNPPILSNEEKSHDNIREHHQTHIKTQARKVINRPEGDLPTYPDAHELGSKIKCTEFVKIGKAQNGQSSTEEAHARAAHIVDKKSSEKGQPEMQNYQPDVEQICREYFLNESAPFRFAEEEKRTQFFYDLLKSNLIFEEMEKKIKNNFPHFFYLNGKKLNDAINKDNWVRIPTGINQFILKKKFRFFHVISLYKKTFYDFLNVPFSENPLITFNFKRLEEKLCSETDLPPEDRNAQACENWLSSKLSNHTRNNTRFSKSTTLDSDLFVVEKKTNNRDSDETNEEAYLNKTNKMVNKKEIFHIINFDIVLSNSSSMLISVLQNYLMLEELLPNFKDEIRQYILKVIDFYMYILCCYFMKRETLEELLIDLKKYNDRLGINNLFFIIKKQEKYKHLYNFLIFYTQEIRNNTDNYHFLDTHKNSHHPFQQKYNVTNCSIVTAGFCPPLSLNNFCKIYSSTCHYAISEKIISIESFYCLVTKLKEEIMPSGGVPTEEKKGEVGTFSGCIHIPNGETNQKNNTQRSSTMSNHPSDAEWDSFLPFLEQKLHIVDELRILVYCDSLYELVDSSNYISEVVKLVNDACSALGGGRNATDGYNIGTRKDLQTSLRTNLQTSLQTNLQTSLETNLQTGLETNLQTGLETNLQTNFQTHMNQFMNLYINILNDAKRKLTFCCDGVVSVVVHYLLWNLINYIFNLNNIEIVHQISSEVLPVVAPCNRNNPPGSPSALISSSQGRTNQRVPIRGPVPKGKEEFMMNQKKEAKVLCPRKDAKFLGANLVSNNKSDIRESSTRKKSDDPRNSNSSGNFPGDAPQNVVNTLKKFFSTISKSIIQHITNLEREVEEYLSQSESDSNPICDVRNSVYMNLYRELKNVHSKRHRFYYIFLANGINYYDQYVDLHLCNLPKLDQLVKCANADFFQYKHVHSVILKYHDSKLVPESYVTQYEMSVLKEIQSKMKSRIV
ncbi:hypothetical protein C922_03033 [Plasmodium inui San Antonio 1]|uniref:Uncharacterized protein n=1 Tax=Plasmodium inui San Antonio 1 TaxID=1237626 RepID=W7A674_9APIC|nr:hypothetical protein C922_03033 [Plasmodium inui San Antonio 1]EUD66708.1 hypothetical protein C922_03033 [Plasmodium inui San Antonio 1]